MSLESRIAGLPRRLPAIALVATAIGLALFAVVSASWFRVMLDGKSLGVAWLRTGHGDPAVDVGNPIVKLVVVIATLYFFARLFAVGLLLVLGGPTTRRVAWLTPSGARLQGAIVIVVAIVAVAWPPAVHVNQVAAPGLEIARSGGGALLVGSLVLAQLAIQVIARDPSLAATQGWFVADVADVAAPPPGARERPMRRPPLPSPPVIESDPFRAPPRIDVASIIVQPDRAPPAVPRSDDANAPPPSVLR